MRADIHPGYKEIEVTCSCGNKFKVQSTATEKDLHIDVCDKCHPFYTGKQKVIDTAGRIDRFKKKFGSSAAKKPVAEQSADKR